MRYNGYFLLFCVGLLLWFVQIEATVVYDSGRFADYAAIVLNSLISLCGLYRSCRQYPFSLLTVHWTFVLFFFCMAPYAQYATGEVPSTMDLSMFYREHSTASFLVLIWCLVVIVIYPGVIARSSVKLVTGQTILKWNRSGLSPLLMLSSASLLWLVEVVGLDGLFYRRQGLTKISIEASPMHTAASTLGRSIAFACAYIAISKWASARKISRFVIAIIITVGIISNFPTGVARFWTGGLSIGLACIWMKNRTKNGLWLPSLLLFSFLMVMPFLGVFRRATSFSQVNVDDAVRKDLTKVVTSVDFDAYSMLVNSTAYIKSHDHAYGSYLVGNLLFFIPRAWWPEKPEESNKEFIRTSTLVLTNDNLSQPLPAEGLMNFGLLGVPIYAAFFALACKRLDNYYWTKRLNRNVYAMFVLYSYPFLCGFLIFILRGAFLPTLAFTSGFLAGSILCIFFYISKD